MTIAFVIALPLHLAVASLIAWNSVLEAERPVLAGADLAAIALVSLAWPAIGCALLSAQACRRLCHRGRRFLPAPR